MRTGDYTLRIKGASESEEGYVYLAHGTQYTLVAENVSSLRCNVELKIDGNMVGAWRIPARGKIELERPVNDPGRFTFFETGSREAKIAGLSSSDESGVIEARFIPEVENDADLSSAALYSGSRAGGTGLTGHSEQEFGEAEEMELDLQKAKRIWLRLVSGQHIRPLRAIPEAQKGPPPAVKVRSFLSRLFGS